MKMLQPNLKGGPKYSQEADRRKELDRRRERERKGGQNQVVRRQKTVGLRENSVVMTLVEMPNSGVLELKRPPPVYRQGPK